MEINSILNIKITDIAKDVNLHPISVSNILKGRGKDKQYTQETIERVEQEVLTRIINNGNLAKEVAKEKGYLI